jgi:MFS family permease
MVLAPEAVEPKESEVGARWRALAVIALAELLGMSLWFSGSAVVPSLRTEWQLSDSTTGWLTIAVQLGFVLGTLLSAFLNLADIIHARTLFAIAAISGALTNGIFAVYANGPGTGISLRFLTGMFLAGVYPPGMKIMATWFRQSRGMALGVLVGALTLGKASPYLINGLGSANWRHNVLFVSILAVMGGVLAFVFVGDGPFALALARFDWKQSLRIFRNRGVRLANFGYFGHMWELYAMWTWVPVMIRSSLVHSGSNSALADWGSFLVIGSGAIGCVIAGFMADRVGRTVVTSGAMIISGGCCLLIGFFFGADPAFLLVIAAVWGASVVADSAQFSTCVTELTDPRYTGTALTLQTSLGFLLTTFSIELVPRVVDYVGWQYAFVVLAPGPIFGVASMLRLRALPESSKIANGRR